MALQPVLKVLTVSDTAESITVADATGLYEVTANPGGFGVPNPTQAEAVAVLLQIGSLATPDVYQSIVVTDPTDLFNVTVGYPILPASAGLGSVFPDGVYDIKYNLGYVMEDITITPAGLQFALVNADTIFATAVGFILPNIDSEKVYYIDRTKVLNAAGGFVTEAFPSDAIALQPAQQVYEGTLKLLVNKAGNNCLIQDIAAWSAEDCADMEFRNIWKRYKMKVAMEAKFSQRLLLDAHRLAVSLEQYCSTSNTSCGC